MEVRVRKQKLQLGEWEPVEKDKQSFDTNWVRRLNPTDNFSCVGWMQAWECETKQYWAPMFHGPILYSLCDIYYEFYPSPRPYKDRSGKYYSCLSPTLHKFHKDQLQEAKDHLDKFIHRFNKMKIWI